MACGLAPRTFSVLLVFALTFVVTLGSARLTEAAPDGASALELSEAVIGRKLDNYRLINQDGKFTPFSSFRGKATLVSFMYVDCPGPCPMINHNIRAMLRKIDPKITQKLTVVSISLDPQNDDPETLRDYGLDFTDDFNKWSFVRADDTTLALITRDMGFRYEKTGDGIEHMNRLTLIGPDGVILRHFYGAAFDSDDVQSSVKAAIDGRTIEKRLSDSFSKILLYCSNYDPVTGTYKIDYFFVAVSLLQYALVIMTLGYFSRKQIARFFRLVTFRGARH